MKYCAITVAIVAILWTSSVSAEGLDIKLQGRRIGSVENIIIEGDDEDSSRLLINLTAKFGSFTQDLDRFLRSKGNFAKKCSTRIYWSGNTSVRGTGKGLRLSSRLRFEKWICKKVFGKAIRTKIVRDTKTVHWRLFIKRARIDQIRISAQVENIKNFPDDLEKLLGLRIREEIKVPIPARCGKCKCSQITDSLKPVFENVKFWRTDETIHVKVEFSILGDVTKLSHCL